MSEFPRTEADTAALALVVIQGREQAAEDFPNPPVPAAELRAKLERRLDALDRKVDAVDHKLSSRIEVLDYRLSSRIDALDAKISRHFTWTVGIQVAVLLAVVAALAGR